MRANLFEQLDREKRLAAFSAQHGEKAVEVLQLRAESSDFARSLLDQVVAGRRLSDKQVACVLRMVAEEQSPQPVGGDVDLGRIRKLFSDASASGYKRPAYRADRLTLSLAPATGKNPGAIYVKDDGEYAGKVLGTIFEPARTAKADVIEILQRVAADPLAEAVRYGRRTGRCACCGLTLTNKVSIELGIGPICRAKWGL
jgi:hypothetical protein